MTTSISIGNFDAVHRGHVALVEAARLAAGTDGRVVVFTFDPSPASVLRPDSAPGRLTSASERRDLLMAAGASDVRTIEPTAALLGTDPEAFLDDLMAQEAPDVVVEGPGFRFGCDRAGSIETLRNYGRTAGFSVVEVEPLEVTLRDDSLVRASSSIVRWLLARGRIDDAATVLGRSPTLSGTVVEGDRRGRDLGIPTANLDTADRALPGAGIYAGQGTLEDGTTWPAAISVGTKPTFDGVDTTVEAHLVRFSGPLDHYGWTLDLTIDRWLRDQVRFDSVDALVAQMGEDVAEVTAVASMLGGTN